MIAGIGACRLSAATLPGALGISTLAAPKHGRATIAAKRMSAMLRSTQTNLGIDMTLVERLRAQADTFRDTRCELLHEAADMIERQQAALDLQGKTCADAIARANAWMPNPFTTPLDDPRMVKMQDETAKIWER